MRGDLWDLCYSWGKIDQFGVICAIRGRIYVLILVGILSKKHEKSQKREKSCSTTCFFKHKKCKKTHKKQQKHVVQHIFWIICKKISLWLSAKRKKYAIFYCKYFGSFKKCCTFASAIERDCHWLKNSASLKNWKQQNVV